MLSSLGTSPRAYGRAPLIGLLAVTLLSGSPASAATSAARFDEATRFDLKGDPKRAFETYLELAQAGLPEAQFNVAVMLDSGRGAPPNVAQAAIWYARAAAHGERRAAYNLGQLYETGDGVPRNADLARAWFAASALPASLEHISKVRLSPLDRANALTAPKIILPRTESRISAPDGKVELVWSSRAQPESVEYFIELQSLDETGSHEAFSGTVKVSSLIVSLPPMTKRYAWRVSIIAPISAQYLTGDWSSFDVD